MDEYDKPLLDNIEEPEKVMEMREGLKNFYSALKKLDSSLQFVFLTGVSKFSKVNIFSGVNNLNDLTLDPNYATICGYTHRDMETIFAEHLAGVDWEELLSSFEVETLQPVTLLFQTGYLSVKGTEVRRTRTIYHLGFPNLEVKNAFTDFLITSYTHAAQEKVRLSDSTWDALRLLFGGNSNGHPRRHFQPRPGRHDRAAGEKHLRDGNNGDPGRTSRRRPQQRPGADTKARLRLEIPGGRLFELGLIFSQLKRNLIRFDFAEVR